VVLIRSCTFGEVALEKKMLVLLSKGIIRAYATRLHGD
jgi:hypothetical protein